MPFDTRMASSSMSSALSVTSSKLCGRCSDESKAQYCSHTPVMPPVVFSFSIMMTSEPASSAVMADATPAAPVPTTTMSVS